MWSFDFSSAPSAYVWGSKKHPKAIYGIISPPLSPTEKSAQETLLVVIFMKILKVNARGGVFSPLFDVPSEGYWERRSGRPRVVKMYMQKPLPFMFCKFKSSQRFLFSSLYLSLIFIMLPFGGFFFLLLWDGEHFLSEVSPIWCTSERHHVVDQAEHGGLI